MNQDQRLPDEKILELISNVEVPPIFSNDPRDEARAIQFDLIDLLGNTIVNTDKIKNPEKYDPPRTNPNPEYFNVLFFNDQRFLLTKREGLQDMTILHSYYYDGNSVRYSRELFN